MERAISNLPLEQLVDLAKNLKVHEEGDGPLKLLRKVRRKVEEDIEIAEDKLQVINQLMEHLTGSDNNGQDNNDTELQKAKEELEKMKMEFNKTVELQKKQIDEASAKLSSLQGGKPVEPVCTNSNELLSDDVRKALRRDFRAIGFIGGDANKDRLSLVSLLRQIETGLKNKYTEAEVIEGVIRAVSPALKLRSYLEMMPGLTIAKLEHILKAHYKQKYSTEIYQELTSACQGPKESAQDFLMRVMDLRQQVLFASDMNDKTVKYDSGLVNGLFRHVIETGLQSETIRTKIRPLLLKPDVSDDELMAKLNIASSEECERLHAITYLTEKQNKDMKESGFHRTHLTPGQHTKIVNIVGEKCMINCLLNGIRNEALWDTGVQVSIIPRQWISAHMSGTNVRDISELLCKRNLTLTAANGTTFPFEGFVEIDFEMSTGEGGKFRVPFLVSRDNMDTPIIGYTVIAEIAKEENKVTDGLTATITHLNKNDVEGLVNALRAAEDNCELAVIQTCKRDIIVPKKQTIFVTCTAKIEPTNGKIPVLFEPDPEASWSSEL